MKPDLKQLLDQAQKMQQNMQKAQKELADTIVQGKAGPELVVIDMNGRHEALRVRIDFSLMEDEKDVLEDLVAAAINDASAKIEKKSQEKILDLTSGLEIPKEFQMPFGDDGGIED